MPSNDKYSPVEPAREEVDAMAGVTVIEFGTDWCGFCQAAQPLISTAFAGQEPLRHIKVEDGRGKPLGRSFRIKLWPTLVFLRDGKEVARVVRPVDSEEISRALTQTATA